MDENKGFTPNNLYNSAINSEVNCVPWSLKISLGIPTRENIWINASATEIEEISLRGIPSGNPVAKSTRVSIYLCPSLKVETMVLPNQLQLYKKG